MAEGNAGSVTNLHDALSVPEAKRSTMLCRKKVHDALSVRSYRT